ncbi:MAG: PHP domain-containing protein [Chloroflexi bacterium]|nr:PHP domain-containing protein [Chloroflexota bacterium]
MKADLHIHTQYSFDCATPLDKIISRCQELGIGCIAVADHGTVEGALKMQEMAPFRVIVAEEVLTPYGEIMGMFLKKTVPSNQSIADVIAQIREQDGLVCIPHPFDAYTRISLGSKLDEIAEQIDILEVFNARSPLASRMAKANAFAEQHSIAKSAGSDAHTIGEIGHAYVEMPAFKDKSDFLAALVQGQIYGRRTSPLIHINSIWTRVRKLF